MVSFRECVSRRSVWPVAVWAVAIPLHREIPRHCPTCSMCEVPFAASFVEVGVPLTGIVTPLVQVFRRRCCHLISGGHVCVGIRTGGIPVGRPYRFTALTVLVVCMARQLICVCVPLVVPRGVDILGLDLLADTLWLWTIKVLSAVRCLRGKKLLRFPRGLPSERPQYRLFIVQHGSAPGRRVRREVLLAVTTDTVTSSTIITTAAGGW